MAANLAFQLESGYAHDWNDDGPLYPEEKPCPIILLLLQKRT